MGGCEVVSLSFVPGDHCRYPPTSKFCDMANAKYFRVATTHSITADQFCSMLVDLEINVERQIASDDCIEAMSTDGSIYGLKFGDNAECGYLYLNATVCVSKNTVSFGHITRFARHCTKHELGLRRNGIEIDEISLVDDVMKSEAVRIASHVATHPDDEQSAHHPKNGG